MHKPLINLNKVCRLLVLVAGVVPVIPATTSHDAVEICVGEDDPRVLAHGSTNIEWTCACDPAMHEGKAGLLIRTVSILSCNGPKPRRNRM